MVFASVAMSATQKPCQPFQGQGIFSIRLNTHLSVRWAQKHSYTPIAVRPIAKWFFPGRGWAGAVRCEAPIAHPLFPGKNKGAGLGVKGQRSSVLIHPGYISGHSEVCKCKRQIKSGIILRNSPPLRPSLSAVLHGFSVSPCQKLLM